MKKQRTGKQILLAALGKAWMVWPARLEAKKKAKDPNRSGWYVCTTCRQSFQRVDIDHIIPIVKPSEGWTNWDDYINGRFVEIADRLQALCIDCHKEKSRLEGIERRKRMHSEGRRRNVLDL